MHDRLCILFAAFYICYLQVDDIRNEANDLLRIRDYLYNEFAKNTGQPIAKKVGFLLFSLQFI